VIIKRRGIKVEQGAIEATHDATHDATPQRAEGVINQVAITVGETIPHPYAQYASLKAEVALACTLSVDNEQEIEQLRARAMQELDATMKVMQERADDLYKGHAKIRG
jgi:hypothetical protein